MARPREFNEDEAVARALDVFWEKGFEAASLGDLTSAMGISKSSFYETFGSKHDLLISTMQRYKDTTLAMVVRILESDLPAREAITQVFDYAVRTVFEDNDRRGCFLGNCIVEAGDKDDAIAKEVMEGFADFTDAFAKAVKRGQAAGDISDRQKPMALARFLANNIGGMRIAAKAGADRRHMEDIVRIVMAALD
ncbi:MAG TPA: TetR/AcrR family transcriptional regulator [Alphaproteobacteria bacterium]|nr:TetR/AcrR family transcriptional regulator [Alphaproteobacteria bacterium]